MKSLESICLFPVLQLPVNDELVWDNGTPFPEPCIDRIADTVGKVIIQSHKDLILLLI